MKYLIFLLFMCCFHGVFASEFIQTERINENDASEISILSQIEENHIPIDSVGKRKSAISILVKNLEQKIKELKIELQNDEHKDKSFFGKFTEGLTNNFKEQKLDYMITLRNFLMNEGDRLEGIGKGIKKVVD